MAVKTKLSNRILSILLCAALLMTLLPSLVLTASAASSVATFGTVADPGTADTWEDMMGTDSDGNRYAGRVWVDKSVYTDGQTATLNSSGEAGSTFNVSLEEDEAFQIIFSALGSSMTTTTTSSSTGPMDVVIVLDNSASMAQSSSGSTTRLQQTVEAANALIEDLLTIKNVRLAIVTYNTDSQTILDLGSYTNGVTLKADTYSQGGMGGRPNSGNSSSGGVLTAYDNNNTALGDSSTGYQTGTNLQSGIDTGMKILNDATNISGRIPVMIVLTDGRADTAVNTSYYDVDSGTYRQPSSNDVTTGVALSTLLNAAYMKASVAETYGKTPMVYGIGVDLSQGDEAIAIINPADSTYGFNNSNTNSDIKNAYTYYTQWASGQTVSFVQSGGGGGGGRPGGNGGNNSYSWTFDHNFPSNSNLTSEDVSENINYVDTYYDVSSADLESTFNQIYEELSSGVFNPITSSSTVDGATGVDNTPLIYVDDIGQYMEIKEIQAVTLFGASYGVIKNSDGTYTVDTGTGTNPTTNEQWNTAEDIKITVTEQQDGTQKLQININQEILPIILEQVASKTVGDETTATLVEMTYNPLRVYYTVGLDSDILLPNGEIDITKIDKDYKYINNTTGEISFYSNAFGEMNAINEKDADKNGFVDMGDAHVGFKPSLENRYYYHQSNQDIFTEVTNKDGSAIDWDTAEVKNEYGIPYEKDKYNFTWLTYDKYNSLSDDSRVYTYVTYYHPTPSNTDAAAAAEEVTYIVYTDWVYLKESVAFYDNNAKTFINYDAANGYVTGDVGYAIDVDKVADVIAGYKQDNANADIYAMLGVGSLRTSRLHNMEQSKTSNSTGTADLRYDPDYTYGLATAHNNNDVVVWLGNNGRLTTTVDTGIALTKAVTEAMGNADDTYALTVTVPAGVTAAPVVKDANGNDVTAKISTYLNNVLTVNIKAGETVYISGIPGGTECEIGENIPNNADFYIASKTDTVTVPTLSEVLNGTAQYAPAAVTNAPNKYGNLTIVKDILHNLTEIPDSMAQKEFTFKVQLPASLANKTYKVDKSNASLFTATEITTGADASFTVTLKDNESITILNLPAGVNYTVTETSAVAGYENTTGSVSATIIASVDNVAHFINTYKTTPIKPEITVTGSKFLTDEENTYTANEDFVFVLSEYVGVSNQNPTGYAELKTVTAKAGGSYTFKLDEVLPEALDLGEYYFRVTEQAGTTAGMTYDSTRGLFAVKVTDTNADGSLEYTVENYANTTVNGYTVTKNFTNVYNVDRTHADINIQKTLENETGIDLAMDLFHFNMVNVNDADETYTVTTDASGKATIRVPNLAEGTYTYKLTEVDDGMAGMDYDNTEYIVEITVTNVSGQLVAIAEVEGSAAVNGDDTVDVQFHNEYKLDATEYTISGTKTLEGRDPKNGEFTFELYETDSSFTISGNAKETGTNTGKNFSFTTITYDKVGTYYYSVKEKVGNVAGVTYDTTHYHVIVTVGLDSTDKSKLAVTDVSVNKIGHNTDETGNIVFVNSYVAAPTEYTISGTKILSGRAMAADEFTFELYEGNTKLETVTNKADGTFSFKAITYDEAGTYTYTIKEAAGNAPGVTYTGVNSPITVIVTVTDTNAVLSAEADIANANIKFENSYEAAPANVSFNGTKELVGAALADNSFTFKLYETDHNFNIEGLNPVDTKKNVDGKFTFEIEEFTAAGTYFYTVVEDASVDPLTNVVYDRTQHNFQVQVSDVGDGQLKVVVTNMNTGVSTDSAANAAVNVEFTNATFDEVTEKEVYLADNTTTHIDGKKVNAGDILTYFITYTNYTGEDAVVDIMDTIPEHTSYVDGSASHNGTYAGTHVNWILNVDKGESVTVFFSVKVDETDAIVANVAVVRDGVNTYTTNEVTNHTVDEVAKKDVFSPEDLAVSIDGDKVYAGDTLAYTISYTNTSAENATVTITDTIPEHTTYVDGSADNGGIYANSTLTWVINDVPAWSTVTVTFKVTVNSDVGAVTVKNEATIEDGTNTYTTNEVSNPVDNIEDSPSSPQAGDTSKLALWVMLLLVSGGLIGAAVYGKKRQNRTK